jgi:sulfatase maturation enzyme AslB (radical SAM superfamily)
MSFGVARRGVDMMLCGPATVVSCEFQGGEALLNFPLVRQIVEYVEERSKAAGKQVRFVCCTNLSTLSDEHLALFKAHDVHVSTSLDGPAALHDQNHPFSKGSSHAVTERNIRRVHEFLGPDRVGALMTTTKESRPVEAPTNPQMEPAPIR